MLLSIASTRRRHGWESLGRTYHRITMKG